MAFSKFQNIEQVQIAYQIRYELGQFFQPISFEPSDVFTTTLATYQQRFDILATEAIRKQVLIGPMLLEVYQHYEGLVFWGERYLAAPDDATLSGHPDFIVSTRSSLGVSVMEKPVLIIVEAKQDDFTKGWGQCLAAMLGAQRFNEYELNSIFGIVTNGETWQFGQLTNDLFERQEGSYNQAEAFGYINTAFDAAVKELAKVKTSDQ